PAARLGPSATPPPPAPAALSLHAALPISGCCANAWPLRAVLEGGVVSTSRVAAPAVPVAVNVTGLPASPVAVAVAVFCPAVALKVHDVAAAIPSAPVVTGAVGVTVPLPGLAATVARTADTGPARVSPTTTEEATITAPPAAPPRPRARPRPPGAPRARATPPPPHPRWR